MKQHSWKHRVRVRSCGVLIENGKVLLVELCSPVVNDWVWIPPGGEVTFGETLEEAVIREMKEETGLTVSVVKQLTSNQVIRPPVHAIEFYFLVERIEGDVGLGHDPELEEKDQILRNIGFFSKTDIKTMNVVPQFLIEILDDYLT